MNQRLNWRCSEGKWREFNPQPDSSATTRTQVDEGFETKRFERGCRYNDAIDPALIRATAVAVWTFSACSARQENRGNGPKQDLAVEAERPAIDVFQIELHPLFE